MCRIVLCITAMLEFARLNRAKDAADGAMEYEGKGDFEEMGDESPLFRYAAHLVSLLQVV